MPRHCSVAGCRSNYDSEKERTTTFSLPKKEPLRSQWLRKIPTDFSKLKNPVVCIRHFPESSVIKVDRIMVNGELKEYQREIPKLIENAVPSIFPNLPSYLSESQSTVKRLAEREQEILDTAVMQSIAEHKKFLKENSISSTGDIVKHMQMCKEKQDCWAVLKKQEKLALCCMKADSECPVVSSCIIVEQNLAFAVYVKNIKIRENKLPHKGKITTKQNLDDLVLWVEANQHPDETSLVDKILSLIKSLPNYEESCNLQFLAEQLILANSSKFGKRYTNQTMIFASCLYVHSSNAYFSLLKSKLLNLPHPKNLQKLISKLSLNSSLEGSISYLKSRIKYLEKHEYLVNVNLDEIYIQPEISFKGGNLYGQSSLDPEIKAKTAQVFMISSIFSKYKDVVSIIPVSNMSGEQLHQMCKNVILEIEKIGFTVLSLISDNNAVNRKAFELFSDKKIVQPCVPHPFDVQRKLFLIFDTVHIIKCIRNNWQVKKDSSRSITFSAVQDDSIFFNASYKHLEQLYELEKTSLVKYGHLLNIKVLYPSNIQKQNVNIALKIFSEKNIAALKQAAKDFPGIFQDVSGTCEFLNIIVNFWKIVNVRSVFEDRRFNDEYRAAVRRDSSLQMQYLRDMSLWLKKWRQSTPIKFALSAQTFQATINTIDAFLLLIPYIFEHYPADYLLLSKFQNDNLEGRFGMYRQLSGSNFYISLVQVLENERKIRFTNNILLCAKNTSIELKTLMTSEEDHFSKDCENVEEFYQILDIDFNFESVQHNFLLVITYIGGFISRKVLLKCHCTICTAWLQTDKEVAVDQTFDFVKELDRGKLILPSECVVIVTAIVHFVMTEIIDNSVLKSKFLSAKNQLSLLFKLSIIFVGRISIVSFQDECMCGVTLKSKLENVCLIACKILINNFVKNLNDCNPSFDENSKRKIRKLANHT